MEDSKNVNPIEMLESAIKLLEEHSKKEGGEGACILSYGLPQPKCVQLTKANCEKIKGTWVGGKC